MERHMAGQHAHTPVPGNGHADIYGVFQVDTTWMKRAGRKVWTESEFKELNCPGHAQQMS